MQHALADAGLLLLICRENLSIMYVTCLTFGKAGHSLFDNPKYRWG